MYYGWQINNGLGRGAIYDFNRVLVKQSEPIEDPELLDYRFCNQAEPFFNE
jgi:hypothetical protein